MKHTFNYLLAVMGLCLLPLAQAMGQDAGIAVTALQLQPDLIKDFQQIKTSVFTVDDKGILRPLKPHEIYYSKEEQHFVIKPQGSKWSGRTGYDNTRLPGGVGTADCICSQSNDDCHFEYDAQESDPLNDFFNCVGSCDCGVTIHIWALKAVRGFETSGGDWFNL